MKSMLREKNINDKKLTMSEMKVWKKCTLEKNNWRVAILITITIMVIMKIIIIIMIMIIIIIITISW